MRRADLKVGSYVYTKKKEEKQSEVLITEDVLHVQGLYSGFSQNNIHIFVFGC